MSKNKQLTEWILHNIDCERYGNTTLQNVLVYLSHLYSDVNKVINSTGYITTKKKLLSLSEEIEELLIKYQKDVKAYLRENSKEIVEAESGWIKDFMDKVGVTLLIPASLLATVRLSPIATTSDIDGMVQGNVYKIRQTIDNSLRTALMTKESTSDVTERLEKRFETIQNNISSDIDTYNSSMFRATDYLMFKKNETQVVFSAILDSRTCMDCYGYSGMTFESSKAPYLPFHNRCRCSLVPSVIAGDGIPTFSEWIETLEDSELKDALGKSRYELYKSGIPVNQFFKDNKALTLEEIKNR